MALNVLLKSVDPLFNTEFPGNLSLNEVNFAWMEQYSFLETALQMTVRISH